MRIGVSGAAGRMGRRIIGLAFAREGAAVTAALEAQGHPAVGMDAGGQAGVGDIGVPIEDDVRSVVQKCDVLIDFSAPSATVPNVRAAVEAGKAVVIGTTGLNAEQRAELLEAAKNTRCVFAPNMSTGVNLLFGLVRAAARAVPQGYDCEIVEAHHRLKKDAPSGTAKRLAEIVAEEFQRDLDKVGVHGREGLVGERTPEEIGILAVRGGDITGEHTVMFVTNGERVELTHRAHSRDAFATGAVQAAFWVLDQPNGVYDMQDVLGLSGDL